MSILKDISLLQTDVKRLNATLEDLVPDVTARQRSFSWIQKEQKSLNRQAAWLQFFGHVIILIVVALFGFGIYVFFNTDKITKFDLDNALVTAQNIADGKPASAPDYSRVIVNSITRFGVLTIIIYAVSVLLNVFRYLIRLSAFCYSRANALSLALELSAREIDNYSKVSQVLAVENIHFGKEPVTPIENVVEMLKASKEIMASPKKE